MITRVSLDWLQVLGLSPAYFPGWILPTLVFAGALVITLFAALGLLVVAFVYTRRIPRWAALGLFAVYAAWIVLHLLR